MQAGAKISDYSVLSLIHRGAQSRLYKAQDCQGRTVALKQIQVDESLGSQSLRRFKREVEAAAQLCHPSLLALLDSGIDPKAGPYLVTPFIDGWCLRDFLARTQGQLDPDAVFLLFLPLLEGLEHLHQHGLIHRDLKPENVMLTRQGQVVVVDFGLAFHRDTSRLTREGVVVGSVPYMSPEQIEGRPVTTASDIWSVGVMIWECLVGQRPFQRDRQGEEVAAILTGEVGDLQQADGRVSRALADLVASCLQKDASERPQDAGTLRDLMLAWQQASEGRELGDLDLVRLQLVEQPQTWLEARAEEHCLRLAEAARQAISTQDAFLALEQIDRGLSYSPQDQTLQRLVEEVSLYAEPVSSTTPAPGTVPLAGKGGPGEEGPRPVMWPWIGAAMLGALVLCSLLAWWWFSSRPQKNFVPAVSQPSTRALTAEESANAGFELKVEGNRALIDLAEQALRTQLSEHVDKTQQNYLKRLEGPPNLPEIERADEASTVAVDTAGNLIRLLLETGLNTKKDQNGKVQVSRGSKDAAVHLFKNVARLVEIGSASDSESDSP